MRILYASNAPWCYSGYGVQGKSLLPRLRELDEVEAIGIFAWYGLQGGMWEWDGFPIYPGYRDVYGNDIYGGHVRHFKADTLITLIDPWVLHEMKRKIAPAQWWAWFPVDTEPIAPPTLNSVKEADVAITYSRWGHQMAHDAGLSTVYIPHGVEKDTYKVLKNNEGQRERFRADHFGDDAEFVVTMVAANKGPDDRKAFGYQLQAFAEFAKDKPGVKMWIHTVPTLVQGQNVDLEVLVGHLGIKDKVLFPDQYQLAMGYPPEWMSALYNCSEVYMCAAKAEGFGIPLIEAQACGIPVITSDFSSQPELVRWGYIAEVAEREWTPLQAWRSIPSSESILAALETCYDAWQKNKGAWPEEKRHDISNKIHSEYSWDNIVENFWAPLIQGRINVPSTDVKVTIGATAENTHIAA